MMNKDDGRSGGTISVLLLLCVFAASVLLTLLLGTRAYSAMKTKADVAYSSRTAISYIAEKIRHGDGEGAIHVDLFNDVSALCIEEILEGEQYITYIYCYDGHICELFSEKNADLPIDAGNAIIDAKKMEFSEIEDNLIKITITDYEGDASSMYCTTRSGGVIQ